MVFILKNLAIGGAQEAQKLADENTKEITAFLCVADDVEFRTKDNYLFKHIHIADFQPIPSSQMAEAIALISKHIETEKIMVFCKMGIGRSASVIIGYLVSKGLGFGEAVEFVAKKKPYISILPELITTIEEALKILKNKK